MLIECKARELDNIVQIAGTKYHFRRASMGMDAPMLCNVGDSTHAAEILRNPEFVAVREDLADQRQEAGGEGGEGEAGVAVARYASMTHEELVEEFKVVFGRDPHPQMKHETLVARLVEAGQK